jgi:hypothetical protein
VTRLRAVLGASIDLGSKVRLSQIPATTQPASLLRPLSPGAASPAGLGFPGPVRAAPARAGEGDRSATGRPAEAGSREAETSRPPLSALLAVVSAATGDRAGAAALGWAVRLSPPPAPLHAPPLPSPASAASPRPSSLPSRPSSPRAAAQPRSPRAQEPDTRGTRAAPALAAKATPARPTPPPAALSSRSPATPGAAPRVRPRTRWGSPGTGQSGPGATMEEQQRTRSHTVTTTASSFAENFSTTSSSFAYDREFLRTVPGLLIVAEIVSARGRPRGGGGRRTPCARAPPRRPSPPLPSPEPAAVFGRALGDVFLLRRALFTKLRTRSF